MSSYHKQSIVFIFSRISVILIFIILILLSPSTTFGSEKLEWRVYTPLRLISSHNAYVNFSIKNDETAYDFILRQLGDKNFERLPPLHDTVWQRNSRGKIRIHRSHFFPESELIEIKLVQSHVGNCEWSYNESKGSFPCNSNLMLEALVNTESPPTLTITLPSGDEISEPVSIKDRLILGLGDSYASGESNPDKPAIVDTVKIEELRLSTEINQSSLTGRWLDNTDTWLKKPAKWLDKQCHRSMLSQHVLAAMRLAEYNPHESITLLPLACSGAEIMNGVLTRQQNPPGDSDKPRIKVTRRAGKTKFHRIEYMVKESQINSAVRHLCQSGNLYEEQVLLYKRDPETGKGIQEITTMLRCNEPPRQPDAIFLSIGGNDVGFSSTIAWAALPSQGRHFIGDYAVSLTHDKGNPICPKSNDFYRGFDCSDLQTAQERVRDWLPDFYSSLNNELKSSKLVSNSNNVFLTAYPNPLYNEDGVTLCDKSRSEDAIEQIRSQLPLFFNTQKWNIWMTSEEIEDLNKGLFIPLTNAMKSASKEYSWNYIDKHNYTIQKHGVCANFIRKDKKHIYPHPSNGEWIPINPSKEWAYDRHRERWIRNLNDTLLFQSDGTDGKRNGAFHPDARAHGVIADALYESVIEMWKTDDKH